MLKKSVLLGLIVVLSLFLIPAGFGATTYTLNTDNTEILEDCRILANAPTTNQNGQDLGVQIESGSFISSFLKYNLTSLPTGKIVTNATFCGFTFEVYNGGLLLHSRHVANYTWTEETITWNANPCSAGNCNTTIQGVQASICANGVYCCVDVTNGVAKDYALGNMNTSFFINTTNQVTIKNVMFRDKETGTNPYLNVTLEDPPETTTSSTTSTTTTTEQTTTTEEETTTTELTTTTTVCPSPTGRCCFIGDVTGDCCLDDNFLYTQKIYFVNGTSYFFNQTTFCSNGCDEGLNSCSVPNFWGYGIVLIFVILIMLALKLMRVW
jgi:hypothetical protein